RLGNYSASHFEGSANMLHPGVFVAFDGVDHLLRRATDRGGTPGGVAAVAERNVVHPCRNSQACGIAASLGTEPPQGDGFLGQSLWQHNGASPAHPQAHGGGEGLWSITHNPPWGIRFLDGFGIKAKIGNLVVLALE